MSKQIDGHKPGRYELVPVGELIPYVNNARTHSDGQIVKLQASIREFGFVNPVLIDGNKNIIAGHGRVEAAKREGIGEVPCVFVEHLTDTQRKAYILADNRLAEDAGWDASMLRVDLMDLQNSGFDLTITGFDDIPDMDVDIIEPDFDAQETLELINDPITQRGNIWQLGNHRLMCGDSTSASDVFMLMGEEKSKLLFTSPPYIDMREYEGDKNLDVDHLSSFIGVYKEYCDIQTVNLGIKRNNGMIIRYWDDYISKAESFGLNLLAWNVWDKLQCGSVGQQSAMIPIRHEWLFVFGEAPVEINETWQKKPASITESKNTRVVRQKNGITKRSTKGDQSKTLKKMESVLEYDEDDGCLESVTKEYAELGAIRHFHPATFPTALPAEYIRAFTNRGDVIVEPFCGSGTTLIACEQLGRKCNAMELDPKYCDVIIKRWETLTGQKAVLNG